MVRLDPRRTRGRGGSAKTAFNVDSCERSLSQSEDPLRILDLDLAPAQKKLTTIKSQRVLSIVDETMKRLEDVLLLPALIES